MLPAILQIVMHTEQLLGTDAAKGLISYFTTAYKLTPEQVANLDSNFRDYVERLARLRAESGGVN